MAALKLSDFYVTGGRVWNDGEDRSKRLAPAIDTEVVLQRVRTDTGECAEAAGCAPGQPCSSQRVVSAIRSFVGSTEPQTDASVVKQAANILGCGSESCVVAHPRFRVHAQEVGVKSDHLDAELSRRFKPKGPRDTTQLLSNFNIDEVLQGWAVVFPKFYNFCFNMMDFERVGGSLARIDVADILEGRAPQDLGKMGGVVRRPCDTFACVLNTDVSTGRGKHWVAVFGDCRGRGEWTVEYFNSAGNPPPAPVTRWLENSAASLTRLRAQNSKKYGAAGATPLPLTDVRHQDSQTECGIYTLYFIRRRLEGGSFSEFQGARIPDDAMIEFRQHLFRKK